MDGLKISPASSEITITNSSMPAIKSAKFNTFALKTPNRLTGLSSVIFIVFDDVSPLNISIATNVANSGRIV
ncbi:hypothetical protein D3C85_1857680 [compost metagenome]